MKTDPTYPPSAQGREPPIGFGRGLPTAVII